MRPAPVLTCIMPIFDLLLSCEASSVESIAIDESLFAFRVRFKCDSCAALSQHPLEFSFTDAVDVPGGRGVANLVASCKECTSKFNVVSLTKPADFVYAPPAKESDFVRVATIEVRGGATPCDFQPGNGFIVKGPSQTFRDVDLSDEWSEFDEDADVACTILAIRFKFEKK